MHTYPSVIADDVSSDSVSARALQVTVDAGSTTVESCVAACQNQGFSLAGVEYGRECCASTSRSFFFPVVYIDNHQGVVHSSSMVRYSLGTIMGLMKMLPFTGSTQTRFTATWVARAIPPKHVADKPCLIFTTLPGRIPSEPLSFQLLASGIR